jgi:hypothetical protein
MSEHDDRVSAAYRGLPREEPSASIDAAILAASRRAAPARRARDWRVPVSIAAVVMLAAGLTFHMRNEQPDVDLQAPPARDAFSPTAPAQPQAQPQSQATPEPAASAAQQAPPPAAKEPKPAHAPAPLGKVVPATPAPFPAEAKLKEASPPVEEERARAEAAPPAAAPVAPPPPAAATVTAPMRAEPAPMPAPSMMAPQRAKREAAANADSAAAAGATAGMATDAPERELEGIAQLRIEGKDAEADKALDEFRRRHPGYHIAPAMWERVKPR